MRVPMGATVTTAGTACSAGLAGEHPLTRCSNLEAGLMRCCMILVIIIFVGWPGSRRWFAVWRRGSVHIVLEAVVGDKGGHLPFTGNISIGPRQLDVNHSQLVRISW